MVFTTSWFPTLLSTTPEEMSWETVAATIRGGSLREKTELYRKALADGNETLKTRIKRSYPCIICQVRVEGGRNKTNIRAYTGVFMVDFDHVEPERMAEAVGKIKADKHTMMCYVTISGEGIRVIARVDSEVTESNFKAAWLTVNEYYKSLTGLDYDRKCSSDTRMSGLAWDPQVYYNPVPRRMAIRLSLGKKPARPAPGRPVKAVSVADIVRSKVESSGAEYVAGRHNEYVSRCIYHMNRYGVTQKDCVKWALRTFGDYEETHPGAIEQIVGSVYRTQADEHATVTCRRRGKATVREVEEYIKKHYTVRRNLLSYRVEYARKGSNDFAAIDDNMVNSIWRNMQNDDIPADLQTLNTILCSDFVTDFHPFKAWLSSLPEWDGKTDYIRQFFSMVYCKNISDHDFHFYTRCWFLAMVASVLDPKVVNHEILTFIGKQGTYKSSFMLNILPLQLRNYFATKNNAQVLDKDDYLMLAENIIISLEEIDAMTTKEVNQLKAFTTVPQVKERPPYARHKVIMPRVASLCATGNNTTFLSDQTGNRRWLPFLIESIDDPWKAQIPYEGMYAQAAALLKAGERYWLNDAEIRSLNEHNRDFLTPDPATELIVTYFTHPRSESERLYMTASKIAARFAPLMKISPTKIGYALRSLGFEQMRTKKGRFWLVAERPAAEIDSRLPKDSPDDLPF